MTRSRASLAVLAALALATALPAQDRPDLSGHWVLKSEPPGPADSAALTDSAAAPDDSAAAPAPASDLRPVLRRGRRPEEQRQLSRLIGMAQPVPAFRITDTDSLVTFRNDEGFTYAVRPGADWDSFPLGDEHVQFRGRWRGEAFEVEFRPPGGGKIVESYFLADSGTYLRLEVVIEHDVLARRLWRARMYRLDAD